MPSVKLTDRLRVVYSGQRRKITAKIGLQIHPAPHLEAALDQIVAQYETVVTWAARVSLRKSGDLTTEPPTKRRRASHPSCVKCGFSISSPWLCLECSLSACWSGPTSHILAHLREAGHNFAVEARTGSLWCNACETIILSRFLDNTHVTSQRAVEEAATVFHVDGKKRREPYKGIAPGQPQPAGESVPCSFRKGLLNLGNTCYMNSVLQSLLANPLLKNNMLADRHNAKACGTTLCIPCEFDKLFAELYEQSTEAAIAPATMLQSLWHISREVNGYGQHDAHEAFIALINGMHLHWRGSLPNSNACQCVIHTLFDGQLQSEVRCCNCNRGGRTVDPVLDLSLSIDASRCRRQPCPPSLKQSCPP
ncbi:hypothetical protein BKA62DRAFT_627329 [Auriculariales sp. MPI-PUGE-AT-0066]|nr:hypothetical protein BKA62DRAFT_627329 [Auriculariales sp. MPI-PUGE-AT-0066]